MKKLIVCLTFIFQFLNYSASAQINSSFTFDGQNRTYIVYTPASYVPGNPLPLVLVLHGLTQTGLAIMNVSNFNSIADTANFIVVYPDGIANSWNINATLPGASTTNDIGFIEALIDTISANYSVNSNRVYSCGFSAGGFMSHMLACKSPKCFAAIASVSGTMTDSVYNNCVPAFHLPVLQIHGTSDNIVSYNGSLGNKSVDDVLSFWKSFNQCYAAPTITAFPNISLLDFSTADYYDFSPCANNNKVAHIKVNGGGHQWPGTTNLLGGLGAINMDINASAEIWKFFRNYSCSNNPQSIQETPTNDFSIVNISNHIFLVNGSFKNCTIEIYNLNGQLVQNNNAILPYEVNLDGAPSGLYLLKIKSGNNIKSYKLLVP